MRRIWKFTRWILLGLLVLGLITGAGGYVYLRQSLPQTDGTIELTGIQQPVTIVRDQAGVPHIQAANYHDGLFGLGFVHAQDRLWQLEFQRRLARGELSEVLGAPTIETDRFLRALGLVDAAVNAWNALDPASQQAIQAYIAGINQFIIHHDGMDLPPEFTILGFSPRLWQPIDVLLTGKLQAWSLGANWSAEVLYSQLIAQVGPERAAFLLPAASPDDPLILPDATYSAGLAPAPTMASSNFCEANADSCTSLLTRVEQLHQQFKLAGSYVGSNSWVLAGQHTSSGKPLLANDPHLAAQAPSIWYLAQIQAGELDVIGATLPGVPAVMIGHNHSIAWGLTNTGVDVQDLVIERLDQAGNAEYMGKTYPLARRDEIIKVKDQPDHMLQVRSSRNGPIISDVDAELQATNQVLALRWTALEPTDTTITALLQLNLASDWQTFRAALAWYQAPMQNFSYADVNNNIGLQIAGRLPIRASGDGRLPVEGWNQQAAWLRLSEFDELPFSYNPPSGMLVSANNQAVADDYPLLISRSWAPAYRARRIWQLLSEQPTFDQADMQRIQADQRSLQADQLLPLLLTAQTTNPQALQALELLKNWDASLTSDSAAAAIYETWYLRLARAIVVDDVGEQLWRSYSYHEQFFALAIPTILQTNDQAWCDDQTTVEPESCALLMGRVLEQTLAELSAEHGSEFEQWRWDSIHQAVFPHAVFAGIEPLDSWFGHTIGNGGDSATINAGPTDRIDFVQYGGPIYRQIVDLAALDRAIYIQTPGQSAHILSTHFDDLLEPWQRGEYLPMRLPLPTETQTTLKLQPE
ncbi:MAG: penicillin acylase family protein [Chloroflexi bacterium]|nr:penicillin acylase family protein [Chloroflexota bacterium]